MPLITDRRQWLAWLAAAGLPGWATAAPAGAAAVITLAPLALRERRLGNGLQVVSVADPGSATVSVQLWYRVGSKDDPKGRSGFAHLFEHIMYKRTRHMANEMFDRLTEDVGGQNNAYTADDMTVYQNEVPANHLERLLWAEAERMAYLNVDQAAFDSERKVVIEELRERVLADPYGRLFNALPRYAYDQHPYQRPGIGNEADLMAATLDDVRSFHATYYRPDNALLIVTGDFAPPQLDGWVDRYFAPLQAPATPIPRVTDRELPRQADRRVDLHGPNVPLPAVALLWKGPPAAHPDAPALQVAAALLSAGESGRLNTALVYGAQAAQAAGFSVDLNADAGMLVAYAIAANGQPPALSEWLLLSEIKSLARGTIGTAELDKVRTRLLTAALLGRQTPQGQAAAIGDAVLLHGDARDADRVLGRLQAVSVAQVQRVLEQYLLGAHRVTIDYSQEAS